MQDRFEIGRRRLLAGVSTGAAATLAGCGQLSAVLGDGLSGEWETDATDDADAEVVEESLDGGELELSVVQCNTATVTLDLGAIETTLDVEFDWEVEAEEWCESRVFQVLVDDEVVYDQSEADDGIGAEAGSTVDGTLETEVDADGETVLRFGLEPSAYCGNADHGETTLTVADLVVRRA